ncbi:hypothetical protein [Mangrovicoccus algicola]|uniref:Uncharacterized protein n=1 Tax=Mangrovicoccus algicola TaxID=2771008 RepID=A0A8J6YZY7_9RHOB|nr:hypothetical protein [Mangrovicoccus algicola]MBE3639096.1 hypothetical protein [Mangrovicoccus algicola]
MTILPLIRILLRYGSGALVSAGLLTPRLGGQLAASDEAAMIAAGLLGVLATELGYLRARRTGGAT